MNVLSLVTQWMSIIMSRWPKSAPAYCGSKYCIPSEEWRRDEDVEFGVVVAGVFGADSVRYLERTTQSCDKSYLLSISLRHSWIKVRMRLWWEAWASLTFPCLFWQLRLAIIVGRVRICLHHLLCWPELHCIGTMETNIAVDMLLGDGGLRLHSSVSGIPWYSLLIHSAKMV